MLPKLCQDKGNRTKHRPLTTIIMESGLFLLKQTSIPSKVTITLTILESQTCCCRWTVRNSTLCTYWQKKKRFCSLLPHVADLASVKIQFSLQQVFALHIQAIPSLLLCPAPKPWLWARLSNYVVLHTLAINAVKSISSKPNSTVQGGSDETTL